MVENRYEPPIRQALSDDELLEALGERQGETDSTLTAIAVLERETALRNADRAAFEYWVAQMIAENSVTARAALAAHAPEALAGLEEVVPSAELHATVSVQVEPPTDSHFQPTAEDIEQLAAVMSSREEASPARSGNLDDPKQEKSAQLVAAAKNGSRQLYDFLTSNDRGKATSQFWAWFGISGTALPVLIAALFARLGFSFGQSAAALALGFIGSAVIISVGSLAGKRSGLPTAVISRAAFGVVGNYLPALTLIFSRVFWVVAASLVGATLIGGVSPAVPAAGDSIGNIFGFDIPWATLFVIGLLFLAGLSIAFGGRVLASVQKFGGLLGVTSAAALLVAEWPRITSAQLTFNEGVSNLEVITGAILVVAGMGLAWVSAGADFARKLPTNALGVRVVGWALLGLAVVPTVVGIAGAATFSGLKLESASNPLREALSVLPSWAPPLLVPGMILTIVVWIAMALYSANLGFQALGAKFGARIGAALCIIATIVISGFGYQLWSPGGLWNNLAGLAVFLGVPVAAWSGIFIADVLLRRIAYHEVSLSRSYGFYGSVNWVNLVGWILAVTLGASMVEVNLFGLNLTGLLRIEPAGLLSANFGLFVSGALGFAFPLLFGLRRIRNQEREVLATEARRRDLAGIFDGNRELGFD